MEHIRLQEKLKAVESKIIVGGVNLVSKPAMTLSLPHFIFNPLTPKIQRSFLLTVCYTFLIIVAQRIQYQIKQYSQVDVFLSS